MRIDIGYAEQFGTCWIRMPAEEWYGPDHDPDLVYVEYACPLPSPPVVPQKD